MFLKLEKARKRLSLRASKRNATLSLKKKNYLFKWRIITFPYCDVFSHTSVWINYRYTCVPTSWNPLLPPSPPHLSRQPASLIRLPLAILHMVMYMLQCYSIKLSHPLLLPLSPKLFFVSMSLLLTCTWNHQYHLSRFHIYVFNVWYLSFSFWLTSLCIIGPRFIHLIRTDSNSFL